MGIAAWICGILGGLSAVWSIITAAGVIDEFFGLTWEFWMALGGVLLLGAIALAVGGGAGEGFE